MVALSPHSIANRCRAGGIELSDSGRSSKEEVEMLSDKFLILECFPLFVFW
jgi:hypothetical protein